MPNGLFKNLKFLLLFVIKIELVCTFVRAVPTFEQVIN